MSLQIKDYHPFVVEGMGGYDHRDPALVATKVLAQVRRHWKVAPPVKPIAIITQGDPIESRGVAAITRYLADALDVPRLLVYLDPEIAAYHVRDADRYRVTNEFAYSALIKFLGLQRPDMLERLEVAITQALDEKNRQRLVLGKLESQSYYYDFAMLQEVTKASFKLASGGITVAHTYAPINPLSVTSFYEVGLALGSISESDIVPYAAF